MERSLVRIVVFHYISAQSYEAYIRFSMQSFPQILYCSVCINSALIQTNPLLDFLQSIIDYKSLFRRIQHCQDYRPDFIEVSTLIFYGDCNSFYIQSMNQIFHWKQDNNRIEQAFLNEVHEVYMQNCMKIELDQGHNGVVLDYMAEINFSHDLSDRVCSGRDGQFLPRISGFFLGNYACLNRISLTTCTDLAHTFAMIFMWIFDLSFNSRVFRGSIHRLINKNN